VSYAAYAAHLTQKTDEAGFPALKAWEKAPALRFDHDWKGENHDPQRATQAQILWTRDMLYLRFQANYRTITIYSGARNDGWCDELWNRDVAEAFLQPDASDPLKYKEFEVAPNGFWIDLDISHGEKEELHSRLQRRVVLDKEKKTWTAVLAIPMKSLTPGFDPRSSWRVNFYRVEGAAEPRFYSAWSPTFSPMPNFHVPKTFGELIFRE